MAEVDVNYDQAMAVFAGIGIPRLPNALHRSQVAYFLACMEVGGIVGRINLQNRGEVLRRIF
jgi:hypothetical protein